MVHESPQQSNNESKSSLFVFLVHLIETVNVSAKMLKGNKDFWGKSAFPFFQINRSISNPIEQTVSSG